jgi:hypothetical protein
MIEGLKMVSITPFLIFKNQMDRKNNETNYFKDFLIDYLIHLN